MDDDLLEALWNQFGAALDMLENAVVDCPPEVWGTQIGPHEFWYLTYHTLFFLDLYASESSLDFQPPFPFTLSELDSDDRLPERVYTKQELLSYLEFGRQKSRQLIRSLTPERARQRYTSDFKDISLLELSLYNMRHVQHHAAQLNMLLRQHADSVPRWVSFSKLLLRD